MWMDKSLNEAVLTDLFIGDNVNHCRFICKITKKFRIPPILAEGSPEYDGFRAVCIRLSYQG